LFDAVPFLTTAICDHVFSAGLDEAVATTAHDDPEVDAAISIVPLLIRTWIGP
jgi:hypothetical protein